MASRAIKEVVEVDEHELGPLVSAIGSIRETGGWINLTPGVPTGDVPDDRSLLSFFIGSAGPKAPLATWMPSTPGSTKPGTLGILHGRGRLHREGIAALVSVPSSWRCKQDHARRGLLFEVRSYEPLEMAETIVGVVEELTTVTTTGRYLAEVFRRPRSAV